jgi:chromosome segregation ATPase
MAKGGVIETGVDRLVRLVNDKKSISTVDAAKELGVSPSVIEEWSDFLEEEGIISLDYKLAKTYLIERKLSKKEISKKEKEYHSSKEAFIRKVESAITSLEKESEGLEKIRLEFATIKKELGSDIDVVREELEELENYEKLKKSIDQQMIQQQEDFRKRIHELDKELSKERSKYQEILDDIDVEKVKLEEERTKSMSLKEQERLLLSKLDEFTDTIKKIKDIIQQEDKKISLTGEHIEYLEANALKIKSRITDEKKKLEPLIEQSKQSEKKIMDIQQNVLKKFHKAPAGTVSKDLNHAKKFQAVFTRKNDVEKILNEIDSTRDVLKEDLNELIKKATAFNLTSNKSDVKGHVSDLEKKYKDVEKKRETFRSQIGKLLKILKS